MGLSAAGGDIDPGMSPSRQLAGNRRTRRCLQRDGTGLIVRPLRHLLQLQPMDIRPRQIRGLRPSSAKHHSDAKPCVLLPVGSWLLPICWPVAASRSRSFAGATPPEQPCRTSLAHRGSISSSELLSRRAGCRISLCPPGRRKTGTEIAPRESERVAGPILAIRIYPR
jgi:hypothetical protein